MWDFIASSTTIVVGLLALGALALRYVNKDTNNAFNYVISRSAARSLRGFHMDDVIFYRATGRKRSKQLFQTTIAVWLNSESTLQGDLVNVDDRMRIDFMGPNASAVWDVSLLKKPSRSSGFNITKQSTSIEMDFEFVEPGDVAIINVVHDKANLFPEVKGRFMSSNSPKQIELYAITNVASTILNAIEGIRLISFWLLTAIILAIAYNISSGIFGEELIYRFPNREEEEQFATVSFAITAGLSIPVIYIISKIFYRFFGNPIFQDIDTLEAMEKAPYSWVLKPILSSRFRLERDELENLYAILPAYEAFKENRKEQKDRNA